MSAKRLIGWLSVVLLCNVLSVGFAQDEYGADTSSDFPLNVFRLSATATGDAPNDLMRVSIVAQDEGDDSAELQSRINATMEWALSRMRPYTQIDVKTQDYQTFPTYNKERRNIVGWRASQTLRLQTTDVKSAGDAIRKLQERMQVTSIRFEPTPSTRSTVEDQLINEALDAFKQRADLIRLNIGAFGYNLLEVDVNTNSSLARPSFRSDTATLRASSIEEPALEAGTSQITVNVHGRIQLGNVQ